MDSAKNVGLKAVHKGLILKLLSLVVLFVYIVK